MLLLRQTATTRRTGFVALGSVAFAILVLLAPQPMLAASSTSRSSAAVVSVPKHLRPIPAATMSLHDAANVSAHDPVYFRIFKEESELEVWRRRADGHYVHVRTFPICTFSGQLGPKTRYADYQAPEGFYSVTARQLKPDSGYHLAFNIGYPNAVDRSLGRTGDLIMVHGKCKSVGCFAMTDGPMEEIYAIARDALRGGQTAIPVHSFPFRMTETNIARHASHRHAATWSPLIDAYRDFEVMRTPPEVAMCGKGYVVNPVWDSAVTAPLNVSLACPPHTRITMPAVEDRPSDIERRMSVSLIGPKQRTAENLATWGQVRARAVAQISEQRRLRRERFRSIMAARDQLDPHLRMNLGMGVSKTATAD